MMFDLHLKILLQKVYGLVKKFIEFSVTNFLSIVKIKLILFPLFYFGIRRANTLSKQNLFKNSENLKSYNPNYN